MTETNQKPKYIHNCNKCTFLSHEVAPATTSKRQENADLYFCPQSGTKATVIARFSNENSDYASGLELVRRKVHTNLISDRTTNHLNIVEKIIAKTDNSMEYFVFQAAFLSFQQNLINSKLKKVKKSEEILSKNIVDLISLENIENIVYTLPEF